MVNWVFFGFANQFMRDIFDEPESRRGKRVIPMSAKCREVPGILQAPLKPSRIHWCSATGNGNAAVSRRNLLKRELKPACEKVGLKGGMALATARVCNVARCGWNAIGNGAGTARAFILGNHA